MQTQERPISYSLPVSAPPPSTPRDEFLFGVASSDHQCEAYDPRYPDNWDLWEQKPGMTPRGRATDFWNRYEEDVDLARRLGARAFRFSISWSRVEPEPGVWDEAAFDHYREVIRAIRCAGMEPVVTLMHWVWPAHVQERGGLASPGFPDWFRAYASEVARRLGTEVRFWISLNEPNALPFGYIRLWWQKDYSMPPGLPGASDGEQVATVGQVIRNIFRSHAAAREELKAVNPEARVSSNPCVLGFPEWVQRWLDRQASSPGPESAWTPNGSSEGWWGRLRGTFMKIRSLGILCNTNWWYLGMAGKLPPYLCPPECVGQQDFVALDYYWGIPALHLDRLANLMGAMQQRFGRAPVWSKGVYRALRYLQRMFPQHEILVAENGCPERDDDLHRLAYLQRHVGEVVRACRHGVPVIGYLCWSITTCREWGLPDEPHCDFGLYRVDMENDPDLVRQPTAVSEGFRELIAAAITTDAKDSPLRR